MVGASIVEVEDAINVEASCYVFWMRVSYCEDKYGLLWQMIMIDSKSVEELKL